MPGIRKTAISSNESDLIEVGRIITDNDEKEALRFIKKSICDRISLAQQGKLKSHLDATNPMEAFKKSNKV